MEIYCTEHEFNSCGSLFFKWMLDHLEINNTLNKLGIPRATDDKPTVSFTFWLNCEKPSEGNCLVD